VRLLWIVNCVTNVNYGCRIVSYASQCVELAKHKVNWSVAKKYFNDPTFTHVATFAPRYYKDNDR